MTPWTTERLVLRPWRDSDHEPFAAINADPEVMRHFPSVLTRAESDAAIARWSAEIATRGWSFWAAELRATGELIGTVGITVPRRELPCGPCIEVGWRLGKAFWGRGLATEAARECLRYAFEALSADEVVAITSLGNVRSRAVMERLGMENTGEDFDHPAVPEGHPMRRHCLYRIRRAV